jgi:hypothetical protein
MWTSFWSAFFGVLSLESLDPAGRIDQLLLAGEEGVALGTDFQVDFGLGRTGPECFTARTLHHRVDIVGVNTRFHYSPPISVEHYKDKA